VLPAAQSCACGACNVDSARLRGPELRVPVPPVLCCADRLPFDWGFPLWERLAEPEEEVRVWLALGVRGMGVPGEEVGFRV
jgi:hypothetical protein